MTLLDAMALSAGVALSLALVSKESSRFWFRPDMLLFVKQIMPFLVGTSLTMGCVALARQATYRRRVRAAEWLAIVVFLGCGIYQENWESRVIVPSYDAFGEILALGLVGFGFLWALRRSLPEWSRSLVLGGMSYIALVGPISSIADDLPNLLAPRDGFGPGTWPILNREVCLLIGLFPYGMVFCIPALACLLERIQKKVWIWSEWVGFSVSILIGFETLLFSRGEIREISLGWLAERLVLMIWLIVLCLVSWSIVVYLGPRFWRFLESHQDQDSRSVAASDSRTP
jgi:hypothetical protein